MKQILMIGTGGTIASGKTAEGLMPELTSEQLLARQLWHQPLRRLSGRDGPAGADHKDLFHGRLLHVFIFSILSYPN